MNLYTTLENYSQVKHVGGRSQPRPATTLRYHERMLILQDIEAASLAVDTWCGRHFYPLRAEHFFDFEDGKHILFGDHDLVEAETVYTANRTSTIADTEYYLYTGNDHNFEVYERMQIKNESGAVFTVGTGVQKANSIIGVWTYHERWSQAWRSSLDTVKTTLSSSGTTLEVNHVNGVNGDGYAPRFQVGQIIQIEDEWLYVADTNGEDNELSVARAKNGTVAAEHADGTAIYIYAPMADVAKACRIIVDYFRKLPQAGALGKLQLPGPGGQATDLNIPTSAKQLLEPYRRMFVGYADDEYARIDPAFLPPIGGDYRSSAQRG